MKQVILLLALPLVWFLTSCGKEDHGAPVAHEPASMAVKTLAVELVEWPSVYETTGTVRARTATTISSKAVGYVRDVRVQQGDTVREGQLLASLDARDLEVGQRQAQAALNEATSAVTEVDNAIAAANAQLELARITFKRMKDLHDKKSISEQEFDETHARLKMAEANYEMALSKRRQLNEKIQQAQEAVASADIMKSYGEIKAPFEGTVTEKMVQPGVLAAPGVPLLTIEQAGSYRLETPLEESRLPFVRVGQQVAVELEVLDRIVEARVSEVVPAVDAASRTFVVKINLPGVAGLRSGLFGRARFTGTPRRVVAVPREAVLTRGQVQSAYVVEEGRTRNRLLTLGQERGGSVEVLSGLSSGETVVCPVPASLTDGGRVEVAR